VTTVILLVLQKKAQGVLQEKLLPEFLEQQGDLLAPKDREALEAIHAKYTTELAEAAPEATLIEMERVATASRMQRNKYMNRLGIHARGPHGMMGPGASMGPGDPGGGKGKGGKGGIGGRPPSMAAISEAANDESSSVKVESELPKGWGAGEKAEVGAAASGDSSYQSSAAESSGEESTAGKTPTEAAPPAAEQPSEGGEPAKKEGLKDKTSLDDFKVQKVLGKGSFGTVVKVVQKSTGAVYAMKVMSKKELIRKKALRHIRRERSVLEYVTHPFVVGLLHAFITEAKVYLVLEYCSGGDLHQHLMAADHSRFPEPQARFYTAELVLALEYLHELGVIYRDLKPENVLLDWEGHVRLADFGLCRAGVQDDAAATSFCGSPAYLSPEMVSRNGHGQATDWWGLGVLLYEMLTGDPPFQGRDIEGLFSEIKEAEVQLASHTRISSEALALIKGLLTKESNKRLKASECKVHDFFQAHTPPLRTPEDWQRLFNKDEKFKPPFRPPGDDDEEPAGEGGDKKAKPGCVVM